MSGKILRLGGNEHGFVQLLLPWFDGGRLDADESARVAAHLVGCPRCQADLAWQRKLREGLPPAAATGDVDRGWAALRGRLDTAPARKPERPPRRTAPPWWRWVLALQSTVIVGLAALVVMMVPRDDRYRALGGPGRASDASIVVVFRPEASELQIRQALRDSDARLVDGPTVTGAYLLAAEPARHAAAIERLRQQVAVLRVESLAAGTTR
ncbi:MAG: zf-HC2 domain-containing protein [Burkholderiales bacterium]